jgi:hypothetical protein
MPGCFRDRRCVCVPSPEIEDEAGDDEHSRHRQRLRKHLRGRPLGGFLHAFSLAHDPPKCERFGGSCVVNNARERALGRDSSWPAKARRPICFYSGHPTTSIRFDESPLSEYRLFQGRTAMRRHFGSHAAGLCAWDGIFKAIFRREGLNGTRQLLIRCRWLDTVSSGICCSTRQNDHSGNPR